MRGADDIGRQLAGEVDLLLGQDGHPGAERLGGLLGGSYDPDTLAVIAAAYRLEDHREALALGREARHVLGVGDDAVPWAGHADRVQLRPHHPLVLGVHQSIGTGPDGDAVGLQCPQVLGGDVLMIEGDHIAATGEGTQRVQIAVVANDDITDHLSR